MRKTIKSIMVSTLLVASAFPALRFRKPNAISPGMPTT